MKKYIVVCCYEREIYKVGCVDSFDKAIELMKEDFMEVFLNHDYTQEDFENKEGFDNKWGFENDSSCLMVIGEILIGRF